MPEFPYARYAEMLGLKGIRVERPEDLDAAWDSALDSDRPCVIDAVVDPNVPTLPPHISYDQGKNYLKALLKGDTDAVSIVKQSFKRAWA